jgi:hypothetical protein
LIGTATRVPPEDWFTVQRAVSPAARTSNGLSVTTVSAAFSCAERGGGAVKAKEATALSAAESQVFRGVAGLVSIEERGWVEEPD